MSTISASTTTTTAYKVTADTTGTLVLQTGSTPTTAVTIDTSQNVGIGTASPSTYGKFVTYSTGGYFSVDSNGQTISAQLLDLATAGGRFSGYSSRGLLGAIKIEQATTGADGGYMAFGTCASGSTTYTERARIDSSGNLLVGTTSIGTLTGNSIYAAPVSGGANIGITHASGTSAGQNYAGFLYNGSTIGSITQNGTTGVLYNLTSDYRLKNNQQPLTGAKEFVMALQPKKWQWWDGSGEGVGFIAHEFMEVAKYSGNGEKDAVDENGNPIYQAIQPSSSEVIANLVAHIQNLETRLAALENK